MIRLAALAATLLIAAAPAPPAPVRLDRDTVLIPSSFAPNRQPDGNSIVMAGPRGVIVFDTGRHPWHAQAVEDAVRATGKPLLAIVNSHWHLDHVSGNARLKASHPRATVYASNAIDGALTGFLKRSAEGARDALAKGDLPTDTAEDVRADLATVDRGAELRPDSIVTADRTLTVGGRTLSLHLVKHAATAGDVWAYDAAHRRVLAGDLVTLPAPFLDTACPEGWRRALDAVAATPFTMLVPGHGAVMDRAAFTSYARAFATFLDCANGSTSAAECVAGWRRDAKALIPAADEKRADGLAGYYVGLIRRGGLKAYCTGSA